MAKGLIRTGNVSVTERPDIGLMIRDKRKNKVQQNKYGEAQASASCSVKLSRKVILRAEDEEGAVTEKDYFLTIECSSSVSLNCVQDLDTLEEMREEAFEESSARLPEWIDIVEDKAFQYLKSKV